ncbi:MAG TPA: hypothetical protein VMG63_24195 [Terriglobia bacterium]|nr:hypothetical protein [Terriglobia bacterium]
MSRHSGVVRLRHMLESAREAVALVNGKTRRDLDNTRLLQLGLTRLVEIIGEAAARNSEGNAGQVSGHSLGGCGRDEKQTHPRLRHCGS